MAFYDKLFDLNKIIYLILFGLPVIASTNIDCNGKPFHCVNSTHFMICVDLGGGVSQTIDNFVIPCPPTTECRGINHFECEYVPLTTTVQPVHYSSVIHDKVKNVSLDWEKINLTTNIPGNKTSDLELSEKYFDGLNITSKPTEITTNVNTHKEIIDELLQSNTEVNSINLHPINIFTTVSNIETTETLLPTIDVNLDITLESTTKPETAVLADVEDKTRIVEYSSTEINFSHSTMPDASVTTRSTYFEFFTPDTPFQTESTRNIELDAENIEATTLRTITNDGYVESETKTAETTLDGITLPTLIVNSITPYNSINITKQNKILLDVTSTPHSTVEELTTTLSDNITEYTVELKDVNFTNQEVRSTAPDFSTWSTVFWKERTQVNSNIGDPEKALVNEVYENPTTFSPVYSQTSIVEFTFDRSIDTIASKVNKLSSEQTPPYTLSPTEEPMPADLLYFENSTTETPNISTTSEMVSNGTNESTLILNITPTHYFAESQGLEKLMYDFEGRLIPKKVSDESSKKKMNSLKDTKVNDLGPVLNDTNKKISMNTVKNDKINYSLFDKILKVNQNTTDNSTEIAARGGDSDAQPINSTHTKEIESLSNFSDVKLQTSPLWNLTLDEKQSELSKNNNTISKMPKSYTIQSELYNDDIYNSSNVNSTLSSFFNNTKKYETIETVGVGESIDSASLMSSGQSSSSDNNVTHKYQNPNIKNDTTELSKHMNPNVSSPIIDNKENQTSTLHNDLSSYIQNDDKDLNLIQNHLSTTVPSQNSPDSSIITAHTSPSAALSIATVIESPLLLENNAKTVGLLSVSLSPSVKTTSSPPPRSVLTSENAINFSGESASILTTLKETKPLVSNPLTISDTTPLVPNSNDKSKVFSILDPSISSEFSSLAPSTQQNLSSSEALLGSPLKSHASNHLEGETTTITIQQDNSQLATLNQRIAVVPSYVAENPVTNHLEDANLFIVPSSSTNKQITLSPDVSRLDENKDVLSPLVTPLPMLNLYTASSLSFVTQPVTDYRDDSKTSAVLSLISNLNTISSQVSAGPVINTQSNSNPSIVQMPISNPHIPPSEVTNPSFVQTPFPNQHTSISQFAESPGTNVQGISNLALAQTPISNPNNFNSQIPLSQVTNPIIIQTPNSTLHTTNSQISESSVTILQSNSDPSLVPSLFQNSDTINSQIPDIPIINLQGNTKQSIALAPILTPHNTNLQSLENPISNVQDNSKISLVHSTKSQIAESPVANTQDNYNTSVVHTSNLNQHSSNSQIAENSVANLQSNSDPSLVQTLSENSHNINVQIPDSPITNFQGKTNPSLVLTPIFEQNLSNSQFAESSGTNVQGNFNPSIGQTLNSNPHTSNSQIPLSQVTNPTTVQTPISNLHTTNSQISESSVTDLQSNSDPSLVQTLFQNSHTINSQIPESPFTNIQDNSNISFVHSTNSQIAGSSNSSVVQTSNSNQHISHTQISLSTVTDLQSNSYPSLVQTLFQNTQITESPSKNLQGNINPSLVLTPIIEETTSNSQFAESPGINFQSSSNPSLVETPISNSHTSNSQIPLSQVANPTTIQTQISTSHTTNSQVPESPVLNDKDNSNPSLVQTIFQNSPINSRLPESPFTNVHGNSNPQLVPTLISTQHTTNSQIPENSIIKLQSDSKPSLIQIPMSNQHNIETQVPQNLVTNFQELSNSSMVQSPTSNLLTASTPPVTRPLTEHQDNSMNSDIPVVTMPVRKSQDDAQTSTVQSLILRPHTASNLQVSTLPVTKQPQHSKTVMPSSTSQTPTASSSPVLIISDTNLNLEFNPLLITSSTSLPEITTRNPALITSPSTLSTSYKSHQEKQFLSPPFSCINKYRGRYADNKDCRKFYICIGVDEPIAGICPANTVFSELRKQCTKNLSHCVRENEFQCVSEGRFGDMSRNNIYFICVRNSENVYVRFKFQCQLGYHLNKTSVKCIENVMSLKSTGSGSASIDTSSKIDTEVVSLSEKVESTEAHSNSDKRDFECEREGKFAHPSNCRKYYVCKKKKSAFRRKSKKCDSDEVFHKEKKKCVDADSYEC